MLDSTGFLDTYPNFGSDGCVAAAAGEIGQLARRGSNPAQETIPLNHVSSAVLQYVSRNSILDLHHKLAYWPAVPQHVLLH
jgi:hypothetical protein